MHKLSRLFLVLFTRLDIAVDNFSLKVVQERKRHQGIIMVLVPRSTIVDWRKEWLEGNCLEDGTDCVTPFDGYLYS